MMETLLGKIAQLLTQHFRLNKGKNVMNLTPMNEATTDLLLWMLHLSVLDVLFSLPFFSRFFKHICVFVLPQIQLCRWGWCSSWYQFSAHHIQLSMNMCSVLFAGKKCFKKCFFVKNRWINKTQMVHRTILFNSWAFYTSTRTLNHFIKLQFVSFLSCRWSKGTKYAITF